MFLGKDNTLMLRKYLYFKFLLLCFIPFICFSLFIRFSFSIRYKDALEMMNYGKYNDAKNTLEFLSKYRYKDSEVQLEIAKKSFAYELAMDQFNIGNYKIACENFQELGDFKESLKKANESKYNYAIELYNKQQFNQARMYFQEVEGVGSSELYLQRILLQDVNSVQERVYSGAKKLYDEGKYHEALDVFIELGNYKESQKKAEECREKLIMQRATTISAGLHYSVALNNNGKILCTDERYTFDNWDNIVSVSGFGTMIIGLQEDGTVKLEGKQDIADTFGTDNRSGEVDDWKDIIQVSAGQQHVVGLKSDGSVVSTGFQEDGALDTSDWKNIKYIDAGWMHTVGLDSNGDIHMVGLNVQKQIDEINQNKEKWDNIVAISAGGGYTKGNNGYRVRGRGHTVALLEDGHVVAVGDNEYGQCNVNGEEWCDIVAVSAGDWHTVGLTSDGKVVSTHPDVGVEPGLYAAACDVENDNWTGIVAISAGCGTTMGLKEDGSIIIAGFNDFKQREKAKDWDDIKIYNEWKWEPDKQP